MEENISVIDNRERGCGFLDEGKAYLRADLGESGSLPPFVTFDQPILHLEISKNIRGWKNFPGVQFELAVPVETNPPNEIHRHIDRLRNTEEGNHIGEMTSAQAHDLLMGVGATHYPSPQDFIEECRQRGMNKAIPISDGRSPPPVNPGFTRVFFYHPRAYEEPPADEDGDPTYYGGIIGYSYATRVIWTRPEDREIPQYIKNYAKTDKLEIAKAGEERPADAEPENQMSFDEFAETLE